MTPTPGAQRGAGAGAGCRPACFTAPVPAPEPVQAALPRRLVLALGLLASFGPLSIDVYLPALPGVGADLGVGEGAVGLTVTACLVGLGAGQLLVGPLSDRYGRRPLLLGGVVVFTVCSAACALAPTLPVLVAARFLQAVGGSAGIVLSRAVARDLRSGAELARLFALLLAVNALAPILAPLLGGQLLRVTTWRGSFAALALIGAVLLVLAAAAVPESLPAARRRPGGLRSAGRAYAALLGDRTFVGPAVASAMAFATLLAYITASPFVLQDVHGLSPQVFSAVFAANAVALLVGARLSTRVPLVVGLAVLLAGSLAVLASGVARASGAGLPLVLAGFALVALGMGLTAAVLTASAMEGQAAGAGAASAVLGAAQFGVGGLVAVLGTRGASSGTAVLGTSLVVTSALALVVGAAGVRAASRAGAA